MKTTQTYTLSRFKQLIDLNKDLVNFELSFQVESLDGSDFLALVVDQEYLDKEKNLDYKEAPGSISGNIVSDQNEYRNYFLVLKSISDENVDVRVTVEIEEIEPREKDDENLNEGNVNPSPGHPPTNEQSISKPQNEKSQKSQNNEKTDTKQSFFSKLKSKINLKLIIKILVFLAVISGIVYVYFKYFYKTKSTSNQVVAEIEPPYTSPISGESQSHLINKQNITSQNRTPTSLSPFTTPKSIINTIPKLENFPNVELSNPPKLEIESELPKVEFELPNTTSSPKSSSPTSNLINNAVKIVSQVSTPTKHSMPPTIPSINQNLFNRLRNLDLKA